MREKLLESLRRLPRSTLVDFALLVASAVCFGLFAHGQYHSRRLAGISGTALATVLSGIPERRPANSHVFGMAPPGAKFFNMDSVWTGKLVRASLMLDDGTRIVLGDRTLVTFKRPFKASLLSRTEERVKVVKGQAKEELTQREIHSALWEAKTPEIPLSLPSGVPSPGAEKTQIKPGNARILYMKESGEAKVKFVWPEEVAGYLVIRGKESGAVKFIEVTPGARFSDVTLSQDSTYYWQLVDKDRKLVSGPYGFELRTLTPAAAKELMEQSKRGLTQRIEVYW